MNPRKGSTRNTYCKFNQTTTPRMTHRLMGVATGLNLFSPSPVLHCTLWGLDSMEGTGQSREVVTCLRGPSAPPTEHPRFSPFPPQLHSRPPCLPHSDSFWAPSSCLSPSGPHPLNLSKSVGACGWFIMAAANLYRHLLHAWRYALHVQILQSSCQESIVIPTPLLTWGLEKFSKLPRATQLQSNGAEI